MAYAVRFFGRYLLLALLFVSAFSPSAWRQKAADKSAIAGADPQVRKVVAANTDFGFSLLGQLNRSTPDQNIFFSPFGIFDVLAMALGGAGGATAQEITASLGLTELTPAQIDTANGLLLTALKNPDPKVQLTVANALWGNLETTFDPSFQDRSSRLYAAHIDSLDFASPEASFAINLWAKESTQGKIDQIVTSVSLTASVVVLANVVYFHGTWQRPFSKESTAAGPFILGAGRTKMLPMMNHVDTFPYWETSDFQAVSLPYGEGRLSLDIFLPKSGNDVNAFVNGLTHSSWDEWIAKRQPQEVNLTLPRFKVNTQVALNSPLIALGMATAFSRDADFTPMGLHGPFINTVVHKAILEVDENGTVAAAATQVGFGFGGGGKPLPAPLVMRVDHPFFCAIRDSATGAILFAGVIRDPN